MDDTNEQHTMYFVIIELLPYIYELATIVAGPCIFMALLKYRAVILTFAWWQILLGFGVGIGVVVAIVRSPIVFAGRRERSQQQQACASLVSGLA